MWLDDLDAIASWNRNDEDTRVEGPAIAYICRDCDWRDRGGALASAHQRATGHRVRGRQWPASWPDCPQPEPLPRVFAPLDDAASDEPRMCADCGRTIDTGSERDCRCPDA